jgi:maltoporin
MMNLPLRLHGVVRVAVPAVLLLMAISGPTQVIADDDFEYHAYIRSGVLENGELGKGTPFHAPGAPAKYRLGNEAETYGEAILIKQFNKGKEGPKAKVETLLAYKTLQNNQYSAATDEFTIREAFAEFTDLGFAPQAKLWAGNRFYMRQDIHINDYYWLDTSGYGGGLMDFPVTDKIKFHAAYLRGSPDNAVELQGIGQINKQVLDFRITDIPIGFGTLNLVALPSYVRGGDYETTTTINDEEETTITTVDDDFGIGLCAYHDKSFPIGNNRLAFQYGNGVAKDFTSALWSTPDPVTEDSWKIQVLDYGVIQPVDWFAMMFDVIYQRNDSGADENNISDWWSFGMRPTYYFNKNYSIAVEGGLDYTRQEGAGDNGDDLDGVLGKVTICPQVQLDNNFWARPQLRAFVTVASWSDDFEGRVGGEAYRDDTAGLLYGVQMEAWF